MNYKLYFKNQIERFEKIKMNFIYFLKLIPLDYNIFYCNKQFFLSIISMIYTFDFIRNQNKDFVEIFQIFHSWAKTILKFLNFKIEDTKQLYCQITKFFENLGQTHFDLFRYRLNVE